MAPALSGDAVQVPRGVYWKIPMLPPVVSQPAILPSPAPVSDDTTATWRFGMPPDRPLSASMRTGKLVSRLPCAGRIDDELSIMNSTSTLRPVITALVFVSCRSTSTSSWGAHAAAPSTSAPTIKERARIRIRYTHF